MGIHRMTPDSNPTVLPAFLNFDGSGKLIDLSLAKKIFTVSWTWPGQGVNFFGAHQPAWRTGFG
jgi:hypothetical protein